MPLFKEKVADLLNLSNEIDILEKELDCEIYKIYKIPQKYIDLIGG